MMVNQIRAKNGIPYDSLSYENALVYRINTLVMVRPITSRGTAGSARIEIPVDDLNNVNSALEAAGEPGSDLLRELGQQVLDAYDNGGMTLDGLPDAIEALREYLGATHS
jgi:hypothetical protein